jgi:hypothetical protein
MQLIYHQGQRVITNNSPADLIIYDNMWKYDSNAFLIDRTKTVDFYYHTKLLPEYELPNFNTSAISFEECCVNRAKELVNINDKIYLLWSGGIDSTCSVVSFLQADVPLDNITIICNKDSVREYALFYNKFILGKFNIMATEEFMLKASAGVLPGTIVNSEHADQLFGSPFANILLRGQQRDLLLEPYSYENTVRVFEFMGLSDSDTHKCIYEIYHQTTKFSPRPISTMFDWCWWHNFNFKWQMIGVKFLPRIAKGNVLQTFFSSYDFQNWSVNHKPNLTSQETLKLVPKDIIFDYTKDQSYYDYKIKHQSTTLYFGHQSASAIDTDMNRINFKDFDSALFYNPDNSIAKWLK